MKSLELRVEDVKVLQNNFGLIDLMSTLRETRVSDGTVHALVMKLGFVKLRINPETRHSRPHFHIEYKHEFSASYSIKEIELLAGHVPKKYEKPMLDWARENQGKLLATWDSLSEGKCAMQVQIDDKGNRVY